MRCPSCHLVARDVERVGDHLTGLKSMAPPVGAIVLCECGAVNEIEAPADAFEAVVGERTLRTLTGEEFDRLPRELRTTLERGIEAFKRKGRYRGAEGDLDECAECGHERRQHLDPRWPCSMLACGCPGYRAAPRALRGGDDHA